MNELVIVGKVINFFGIKGELKILSDFDKKDLAFKVGMPVMIKEQWLTITSVRYHKNYILIRVNNLNDINLITKYIGFNIYVKKIDLNLKNDEYLLEDLIGMKVICDNETLGIVSDIFDNKAGKLLYVTFAKKYYIPYNNNYIKQVDVKNKKNYGAHINYLKV